MGKIIDVLKSATGSEGMVETLFKIATGTSSVVSAVNSTRAAHYSKENGKKIDEMGSEFKAISGRLGVVRENTEDIKNGQMAAVNKLFGLADKKQKSEKKKKKDKKSNAAPTVAAPETTSPTPEQPKDDGKNGSKKK